MPVPLAPDPHLYPATAEGAAKGIRVVPRKPDPREFPPITHACIERSNLRCAICTVHCLFGRGHLQQSRARVPTSTRFGLGDYTRELGDHTR